MVDLTRAGPKATYMTLTQFQQSRLTRPNPLLAKVPGGEFMYSLTPEPGASYEVLEMCLDFWVEECIRLKLATDPSEPCTFEDCAINIAKLACRMHLYELMQ
jgi:hypothetical protein